MKTYSSCNDFSGLNVPSLSSVISLPNKNLIRSKIRVNLSITVFDCCCQKEVYLLLDNSQDINNILSLVCGLIIQCSVIKFEMTHRVDRDFRPAKASGAISVMRFLLRSLQTYQKFMVK